MEDLASNKRFLNYFFYSVFIVKNKRHNFLMCLLNEDLNMFLFGWGWDQKQKRSNTTI